ncbi:MAG: VWA domain-containing protein [Syntrophaceae bacterium]|nr:VWA domain-containing protein [Syntrophaceae bacterium]
MSTKIATSKKSSPVKKEGSPKEFSRYWRKNCSRHEATELAAALAAMRKVAGHIGINVKPVYWQGMPASASNSIILNPADIRGTYPIPFQKIDLMVGKVVREAFGCIEWGEWVGEQVKQRASLPTEEMKDYLNSFISTVEDLYISELVRPTVWHLYLSKYWRSLIKSERDPSLPPNAASLASVWREIMFLHTSPDNLHYYYDDLIKVLQEYFETIKELKNLSTSAERRERRVEIYLEMWTRICSIIGEWEEFVFAPDAVNIELDDGNTIKKPDLRLKKQEKRNPGDNMEDKPAGLDEELAAEVSFKLEEGESDLTQHMSVAVEDPRAKAMNTIFTRAMAKCNLRANQSQVERLKRIFQTQKSIVKRARIKNVIRGVDMGKIDAHRLYRVPLDGKIFRRRDIIGSDYAWSISIVADASASMAGKGTIHRPWTVAEQTFVSLTEAAKGFLNHLEVFGYQEKSNQCNLIQLYRDGELYTITPAGKTPTGQAIIAAAMLMKKNEKKKLIIHITDGAANCGINVVEALEYCKKNGINLITIGCGCNVQTKQFLLERYPRGAVYLMDDIRHLSEGLEILFRDRLLKN